MPSPLRYMYFRAWSKVSVGHAAAGNGDACPVGALILVSTFSARESTRRRRGSYRASRSSRRP